MLSTIKRLDTTWRQAHSNIMLEPGENRNITAPCLGNRHYQDQKLMDPLSNPTYRYVQMPGYGMKDNEDTRPHQVHKRPYVNESVQLLVHQSNTEDLPLQSFPQPQLHVNDQIPKVRLINNEGATPNQIYRTGYLNESVRRSMQYSSLGNQWTNTIILKSVPIITPNMQFHLPLTSHSHLSPKCHVILPTSL